jgi:outer-membrane receptor for ferric coprogen and ferric-rhodotorulic acid
VAESGSDEAWTPVVGAMLKRLLGFGLVGLLFVGQIARGAEPSRLSLHIPALPLAQALQELARQTGQQIIFFSNVAEGRTSKALNGRYSLTEALQYLLQPNDLSFRQIGPNTLQIQAGGATHAEVDDAMGREAPGQSATARTDNVSTRRRVDELEEVRINGSSEGLVATRTETPLRDIPQTLSIISAEQLREQNDPDVAEALRHAIGVTARPAHSFDTDFYIRGYPINSYHVDGGAALLSSTAFVDSTFGFSPDLSEYDRIEVLRGADGLFGSNSDPGGTISLMRKRPLAHTQLRFNAQAGSWNYNRMEADVTGPLLSDGSLRGRFVAARLNRNYFYRNADLDRVRVFGALEYDIEPTAAVILGGSFERNRGRPFNGGLPVNPDGSDPGLPRSTSAIPGWAFAHSAVGELYFQAWKQFAGEWQLKLNTTAWRERVAYALANFYATAGSRAAPLMIAPQATLSTTPGTEARHAFDLTLTGTYEFWGRPGNLAIGLDYSRSRDDYTQLTYVDFDPPQTALKGFEPSLYPDPRKSQEPLFGSILSGLTEQRGLFASTRLRLANGLSLIGGARISSDHARRDLTLYVADEFVPNNSDVGSPRVVTPYGGILYDLDSHFTLYGSYASIYRTIGVEVRNDGGPVGAARGTDMEAGIKGAWRNNSLNGSLIVYRANQSNVPVASPLEPDPGVPFNTHCCYDGGTARSRGIDLEIGGAPAPGWLLSAGYTYNMNEAAQDASALLLTPRHLLKLWTSWRLPGNRSRWTIGGDLYFQSSNHNSGIYCVTVAAAGDCGSEGTFAHVQRAYALLGMRTGYLLNDHWQLALSVNNVFDHRYFARVGSPTADNWFGEPRNFLLRVDADF